MKKVLITGANSYIGMNYEKYAIEHYSNDFSIDTVDMLNPTWVDKDFSLFDIVFHVAGIAHSDVGHVSDSVKAEYYSVNTDLAIKVCEKAKREGVKQFVFMSSAIVYGDSASYGKIKRVTKETTPCPANFYGDSKWQADKAVREFMDESFSVSVLRPPIIYGKGSKGNYPLLSNMARKMPLFPNVSNKRSMLYIENLCEFLCQIMLREEKGVFWPQNAEYSSTSELVSCISENVGHNILISSAFNWLVAIASIIPGKVGRMTNKAFGSFIYDQNMSVYDFKYQLYDMQSSIKRTES